MAMSAIYEVVYSYCVPCGARTCVYTNFVSANAVYQYGPVKADGRTNLGTIPSGAKATVGTLAANTFFPAHQSVEMDVGASCYCQPMLTFGDASSTPPSTEPAASIA